MSKSFKIVLILLVIVSVASLSLAVIGFIGKERECRKRLLVEDKLAATLKDRKRLKEDIDLKKKVLEDKEAKILELKGGIEKLSSQIKEEKGRTSSMSRDLAAKNKEILKLSEDLDKEKKEKLTISKRLELLESSYDKAEGNISILKTEKAKLEDDLANLKGRFVDLDKIVVSPSEDGFSGFIVEDILKGRVLVVNKDYNFIVADLGQDKEVKMGTVFEIRDGNEILGKVEIDRIYDTMSSAAILPGAKMKDIKKGNLIIESR